jgi:hypothetical protein
MKQVFQKLKSWHRGKHTPYTLQEMMDRQRDRYDEPRTEHLPDRFDPPLIARFINSIVRFLLRNGKWIIGTLIGLGILIFAILSFLYK